MNTAQAVSGGDRHRHGPAAPDWQAAVADAITAPSSHNSQPWRFALQDGEIELLADPARRLPVVDPQDRELMISCGAALEQLLIALRVQGFGYRCTTNDDPDNLLVARVVATGHKRPDPDDEMLHAAMPERRTSRVPFEMMPPPKALRGQLGCAAARCDTTLLFADDETLNEALVAMTMEGDRLQCENPAFRRELASWMRPNRGSAVDGMRGASLGLSDFTAYAAPFVVRTFDLGDSNAARDQDLIRASGILAVLCTVDDAKYDWITAGRALARIALTATASGHSLSFLNQSVEVPALRQRLTRLIGGHRHPQLVLRFGRPTMPVAPSPRRPVDDVLTRHD